VIVEPGTTLIRRVQVTTADRDRAGLRQKFSLALSSANFQPAGLPASYIVFIRRLKASLPRLSEGQFPTAELHRAVGTSIAEIAGAGVRPARGIVPDSAHAVIFADKAELLECLARDWCDDRLRAHWWWRSLFGKLPTAEDVKEFCRASPQYFPAGLQHLALQGRAVGFVRRFSNTEAQELSQSIARSFALPLLLSVLGRLSEHDLNWFPQPDPFGSRPEAPEASLKTLSRAPWKSCVPEAEADGLTTGQQLLLGVSLMLQRAPATVRARGFGRQVEFWLHAKTHFDAMGSGSQATVSGRDQSQPQEAALAPVPDAYVSRGPTALRDDLASLPDEFSPESAPLAFGRLASDAAAATTPALSSDWVVDGLAGNSSRSGPEEIVMSSSPASEGITPLSHDALAAAHVRHGEIDSDAAQSRIALETATFAQDHLTVIEGQAETQFGGLFYLINLALYLDLYGDLTARPEPDIPLNIWDFVALVGRELIGHRIQSDPVWQLLTLLAARAENTQPGAGFESDDEWRIPADWLKPFATEGLCQWTTAGGRLRLFHPDQFSVFDVPLEPGHGPGYPHQQLQREIKAYRDFKLQLSSVKSVEHLGFPLKQDSGLRKEPDSRSLEPETISPLQLWLSRLMPYVRARLRKALALKVSDDPGSVFGRQPAKVLVTATHLDVYLALADLPIEIRVAGLDRNPGWVPAAGRFIAFYFE
jgi:hypothetical protein